ncbi:adenylate/guanylate cyclase domain-containing protein [Sneathiella marina]|uniref:Adenylate/guanylate cyclase domain-containing protein n=1 Tax=Sneathiella marina TaxID=2950108 RepID=A0ABY4W577_9PROT|nr:adenylate/guanylate cyclase domain-containing protein [Sneathiella marina]USG62064.1 adenylate/guanylate cyclase domain-containing protein [Sneathiella marina]
MNLHKSTPGNQASSENNIKTIERWLTRQMLGEMKLTETFSEFSKLIDLNLFPLLRSHVTMRQLHPFIDHTDHTWYRDGELNTNSQPRAKSDRLIWTRSPLFYMIERSLQEMSFDLTDPKNVQLFPVFSDFKEIGATDYIAFLTPFGNFETALKRSDGLISSWVTDKAGGFTEEDKEILRRLVPLFAGAARIAKREETLTDVLGAYLGPLASEKILDGKNQRGDGDVTDAVIWICDLRSSSALADSMEMPAYLALLNQFFECLAEAVMEQGGEVLKFMGDGFLAIFPTESTSTISKTAQRALDAALEGSRALREHPSNARDLRYGIGIHHGAVMFGNIGATERLDFSVIGPAVNMTSRLQDLTKELGVTILVSTNIAEKIAVEWQNFPSQTIPGLIDPIDVFSPKASI